MDHAVDQGAQGGADGRSVAAGQETAADDRRDDELELAPDALVREEGGAGVDETIRRATGVASGSDAEPVPPPTDGER